jgi:CspA family cold shock protein
MTGRVLWFDLKKGFGFIRAQNEDVFVHYSKILAPEGEFRMLAEGDVVEFETFYADRGNGSQKIQAKNVKVLKEGENE